MRRESSPWALGLRCLRVAALPLALVSSAVVWLGWAASATSPRAPSVFGDGVESLFDGTTLEGWDGDPRFWSVEDGAITGRTTEEQPLEANTFLVWRGGTVSDFELRLQFRISGGNSGIQYRSRVIDEAGWVVGGYQADICTLEAGQEWIAGICYDEKGRGVLARRGQDVVIDEAGEIRVREQRAQEEDYLGVFREGGWNEYVIRAVGNRLVQTINGHVTAIVEDGQESRRALSGVLALQLHTGPPMEVKFKDVELERLDASARADAASSVASMVEQPILTAVAETNDLLAGGPAAQWIWARNPAGGQDEVRFRKVVKGGAAKARLLASCDNVMTVRINGHEVARGSDWGNPVEVDVGARWTDGDNTIEVDGANQGGPAAMAFKLALVGADGETRFVVSDESWEGRVAGEDDSWKPVHSFGAMGMAPWGDVFARGGSVNVETVKLRPGFQLELLYRVPKPQQGSWVTITQDGSAPGLNRFFVCDQYGSLFRVTPGDTAADTTVEKLETKVGKAHGMLWAFGSLYLMGHGPQGTGLYRLFDHDGDGAFEEERFLTKFAVGSEHGAHAIHLGPSGEDLYIVAGNMTELPAPIDPGSPRQNWDYDFLNDTELPPSGHNAGGKPLGGWVVRTDPDGESYTHICGGFRNPYDMAFDRDGELFVYDSDMEYDGGAPWYRPTRVLHVQSGADWGWRRGAGKWPDYYADSMGSVIDIGQGSPTGVSFGYGARFPGRYQRALYLADWTYGRIRAVHLEPSGASYTATAEDFVVGRPMPMTDLTIGEDGNMYFLVGGRRTQSHFFRLSYVGEESTEPVQAQHADPVARRSRVNRRELEAMHVEVGPPALEAAWPHLGSPDRSLRHAARLVLEHQPVDLWAHRALAEIAPQASINSLIALCRTGGPEMLAPVLDALDRLDLMALPEAQQVDALRAWALAFIRLGEPEDARRDALCAKFDALFPTGQRMADREYARVLTYLGSTSMIEPSLVLMESSPIQEEQMYYANLLRLADEGWTLEGRRRLFRWINKGRFHLVGSAGFDAGGYFNYSGGRSFRPYVDVIRKRALETLGAGERADPELTALIDAKGPPPLTPDEQILQLQSQPVVWQVADLVPSLGEARRDRDFARGRAAFHALRCAECHSHGQHSANLALGPDLTESAGRFSLRDLLESIIEPDKEISDQYADRVVWTKDGLMHVGTIIEDSERELVLRPDPKSDALVRVPRAQVDEVSLARKSKMPGDLLNVLDEQQILDLIAFVLSGGDEEDEAFEESGTR